MVQFGVVVVESLAQQILFILRFVEINFAFQAGNMLYFKEGCFNIYIYICLYNIFPFFSMLGSIGAFHR